MATAKTGKEAAAPVAPLDAEAAAGKEVVTQEAVRMLGSEMVLQHGTKELRSMAGDSLSGPLKNWLRMEDQIAGIADCFA